MSWLPPLAVLLATTWLQPACALVAPQPAPTPGAAAPAGGSLTVAVAANARPLFETVLPQFQQATGITVRASYAASGNLYAQIINGAPYDIFFSADVTYPKRLEAEGYAAPGSVQNYALGKIVLWAPNAGKLDVARLQERAVAEPQVERVAIANPELAPYGQAAVAALRRWGVYDAAQDKLVLGENVSQTAHFVHSGAADLGIIPLSLARTAVLRNVGSYWLIPAHDYPPIEQAAVIVRGSPRRAAAQRLLEYLQGPAGAAAIAKLGYDVPSVPSVPSVHKETLP